jgi:Flp pilus assembly protein TadG
VLMPVLIILLGLVADGGRYLNAEQAADTAAEQAARTGASSVDVAALHAGQVTINPQAASAAAANYWASTGLPGVPNVTVNGDTVSVQVNYSIPTELLSMIGISTMGVHVNQSATSVAGIAGSPTGG